MGERLFVYGTLRPGATPAELRERLAGLRPLGEASVAGRLYDLGSYPAAVLDPGGTSRVFGELVALPDEAGLWDALDRYEGFDARDVGTSLFRRVRSPVELLAGGVDEAWIYVWNGPLDESRLLAEGRWTPRDPGTLARRGRRS